MNCNKDMSRETHCPTLIHRVRAVRDGSNYSEQAKKQWDDVAHQLEKDCQMMERLDKTGALEQNENLQEQYVQALKYAEEITKEVAEMEALAVGGALKRKATKKSSKRKAPKRKSTKKSSKRKAPKRKSTKKSSKRKAPKRKH